MNDPASVDYKNPPVVETVLGIQFQPLQGFTNAHLGAFWAFLKTDAWPNTADAPLLAPQYEKFSERAKWSMLRSAFTLTQDNAARIQFTSRDKDRMVQLQKSRLHLNWLGRGGKEYPRYSSMRGDFVDVINAFCAFVADAGLGEVKIDQWEVTYVNHIMQGTVWNTPNDWSFCKLLKSVPTLPGIAQGESFGGEWHFVIPDKRGRLHIQWQHGSREGDEEMIRLTLTARGALEATGRDLQSICAGLDLGHDTIVRSFRDLMEEDANDHWGLDRG